MKLPGLPLIQNIIEKFWVYTPCIIGAVLMMLYPATVMALCLITEKQEYGLMKEALVIWSILSIPVTFGMYKLLRRYRHNDDNDN